MGNNLSKERNEIRKFVYSGNKFFLTAWQTDARLHHAQSLMWEAEDFLWWTSRMWLVNAGRTNLLVLSYFAFLSLLVLYPTLFAVEFPYNSPNVVEEYKALVKRLCRAAAPPNTSRIIVT